METRPPRPGPARPNDLDLDISALLSSKKHLDYVFRYNAVLQYIMIL